MLATKTVRVNVYDFALFLKEDVMEIYYEDGEISNELDETERGAGGYGHTGVK